MAKKGKRNFSGRQAALLIAVVVVCASIGITVSALLWDSRIIEVRELPMSFAVENISGLNVGTDQLYFGSVPHGSSAERKVHVESDEECIVTAVPSGNITGVLEIKENNIRVGPGRPGVIWAVATAPEDAEYVTTYTGTLRIFFRRV